MTVSTELAGRRRRNVAAARIVGALALSLVALFAVDVPQGYLGPADVLTGFGATVGVALVVLSLTAIVALRTESPVAAFAVPLVLSLNVGLFVPTVPSDPLVGAIVILWNLVLLARHFFPMSPEGLVLAAETDPEVEPWMVRMGPALRHLSAWALVLTVGVVGYRLTDSTLARLVCVGLHAGTLVVAAPVLWRLQRGGRRSPWFVLPPVLAAVLAAGRPDLMLSLLALAQLVVLAVLLARTRTMLEVFSGFYDHPSRLVVASFASVIAIGTVLLTFPAASAGPEPIAPLDALFTATSATCVTGLIVLDTPTAFSPFGHGVILALIQIGGLGIMVLSTFAAVVLGGSLGLRGERALTEVMDLQTASTAYRLARFIVVVTLGFEAAGAIGLSAYYAAEGFGTWGAIWRGVFHAVSAFCNAGFALQSDSIVMFQSRPGAVLIVASLIVLGGLGFVVLAAAWGAISDGGRERWPVQAKTVLVASVVLVLAGTGLYAAIEWQGTLHGMGWGSKLLHAMFQSVTLRTAGFNSVDLSGLAGASILFMILFMFIGASPGSTGGGIKTTTATVMLATIRSTVRTHEPVTLFGREIPAGIVQRSLAIAVVSAMIVIVGFFLLLVFEPQPFTELLFEATSAFGTVGLSLGATPKLGPVGKLVIVALMFVGRVGPLTMALLLGTSGSGGPVVRYPESRIMVG